MKQVQIVVSLPVGKQVEESYVMEVSNTAQRGGF